MSTLLEQITTFTKHIGDEVAKLFTKQSKTISLNELVPLITNHNRTSHNRRELLGLIFNTYEFVFETLLLKVETKGSSNQQILEVSLRSQGHLVFSYKSYEDTHSLNHDVQIPKQILAKLSPSYS